MALDQYWNYELSGSIIQESIVILFLKCVHINSFMFNA